VKKRTQEEKQGSARDLGPEHKFLWCPVVMERRYMLRRREIVQGQVEFQAITEAIKSSSLMSSRGQAITGDSDALSWK